MRTRSASTVAGPTRWVVAVALLVVALGGGCGGDGGGDGDEPTTTRSTAAPQEPVPLARGRQVDKALYVPAIGDCFDRRAPDPEKPLAEVILVLPCRDPHTYEVFDLWTPELDTETTSPTQSALPYPEVEVLTAQALDECVSRLEAFVGRPYELSVLEVEPLLPDPEEWALGNRAVGCLAFHRDGDLLEGSQRGADV